MKIIVFGSPKAECKKCRQAEGLVKGALAELGASVDYQELTLDSDEARALKILVTPTVVVDGTIVAHGEVPDASGLKRYLSERL